MSQLNSFRLPVLLLVLVNALSPTIAQAHTNAISRNAVINEFYRQGQSWAFRFLDKESCMQEMAQRKRDCFWNGESCRCVPEEIAIMAQAVTLTLVLEALASFTTGLGLVITACSRTGEARFAIPVALAGAGLMGLGWSIFSQFRFVKGEYKSLVSESNKSN